MHRKTVKKCGLENSRDGLNFDQGNTNKICHKLVNKGKKQPCEVCKFCILITRKPKSHQFTYMLDKIVPKFSHHA